MRLSGASRRRAVAIGSLALASAFGVAMVVVRTVHTGNPDYRNLLWNLFLAWVPFALALAVYDRHRRGASRPLQLALAGLWLLFLPNAPYLLTDFMLLRRIGGVPLWYDVTMLTTFAWTGLLLGFISLYLVQIVVRRAYGAALGWAAAVAALGLSGFGIYLGRFQRWNSWDVLVDPARLGSDVWARVGDPVAYTRTLAVTLALGVFLTLAYLVLYGFLDLALEAEDR
jgi:uncharacterized membrane protein